MVRALMVAALLVGQPAPAQAAEVTGAYLQITADGVATGRGFEGAAHAHAALAAMYDVTGDPQQRRTADELLDYLLRRKPGHMSTDLALQVLRSPYLQGDQRLRTNLETYLTMVLDLYAERPDTVLRSGDIRTLTGRAELLVNYAEHLERRSGDPARIQSADTAARAMLDRVAALQYTRQEAVASFRNDRYAGAFPHFVAGDDGTMGNWDVEHWAPSMLSLDQYAAVRALATGYGRFHVAAYNDAAASGTRHLLGTTRIDPELIYAGAPAGFPLDGATYEIGEETGEHPYLITYGWSPNAIAQLGTALTAVRDHRVKVPHSAAWLASYWRGTPPRSVLAPGLFWRGLDAKVTYTHRFIEATQLAVAADFPWLDLDRTTFPGTGEDPVRRGGWYDGSGRGAMSAVYSRLAMTGYVESGGRDLAMLTRSGQWWERMVVRA
ncbi:hypothetical protein E1218_31995 [Kribbella turkmenica]|uniref:Uncharacterized protein n=1 Tax=Kribbella turkmenica TaxID=2530375 RepID=A0A4R4WD64_9ACTN|nr:hypothetical protein [Kribbella turkmenica]TDD15157.1 hypothetical protein E1218_31995 [Kribbella turkmenica]